MRSRTAHRTGSAAIGVGILAGFIGSVLVGCGQGGERLIPVKGQVTMDGEPLTSGMVLYYPDLEKGNSSQHLPHGTIDIRGNYVLSSATQPGVSAGWYKVAVRAAKPVDPANPYVPTVWLTPDRFTDPARSELVVQVEANAPPGAYDLKLRR